MSHKDAAVYRDAANIIREGGLAKGVYGRRTVRTAPHCTAGAVRVAVEAHLENVSEMPELLLLAELLGRQSDRIDSILGTVTFWNDQPDRTPEDVITLLEQAAEKAEADR